MGTDKGFARSRTYTEVFSADTLLQHYQNLSNTRQYFIEPELSYRYNITSKHSLELNLSGSQRQTQNEQEVLNFSAGEGDYTLPTAVCMYIPYKRFQITKPRCNIPGRLRCCR
ncbi:MAG: hypothetical protein HWD58_15410 [Bacteroidota bacterium]|nr:MAG: hypothetical protein HWD58_15410 [Bacteroidota bacterium]